MAYEFDDDLNGDWAEEISEETTKAIYQNALIRIEDPSLLTKDYDEDTNEWTITGTSTVYAGQARVIGVRWGVESGGESQKNATTLSAIRVQIPRGGSPVEPPFGFGVYGAGPYGGGGGGLFGSELYGYGTYGGLTGLIGRVKRGVKVYVDVCTRNPALENLMFTVTSDLQGSMSASRTFQAALDGDARPA